MMQSHISLQERQRGRGIYRAGSTAMLRFAALPDAWLKGLALWDEDEGHRRIAELFDDPYVNEALWLASPSLHTRLTAWRSGDERLAHSREALLRYVLRMAYRSTPFGLFAGVAEIPAGVSETKIKLPDRASWRRSVRLDSSAVLDLVTKIKRDAEVMAGIRYYPNGSLIRLGDVAHFIEVGVDSVTGSGSYRLSEVEYSPYVDEALSLCRDGITPGKLKTLLGESFPGEALDDVSDFVNALIDKQIICCDQLLRLTSENLLASLIEECASINAPVESDLRAIETTLALLAESPFDAPISIYKEVREVLRRLRVSKAQKSTVQVDLYADMASGTGIDRAHVAKIERVATELMVWGKAIEGRLGDFAKRFSARYGDASVPLLEALDEVAGIGFGVERGKRPPLTKHMMAKEKVAESGSNSYRMREFEHWIEQGIVWDESSCYITITERMASDMAKASSVKVLPKNVTAWCNFWTNGDDNRPVLEIKKLSAQHPGRLFGRFASQLPRIRKAISSWDDGDQGPVMAEIVHLPFGRTGNVVSRPQLTDWEITLRSGSAVGAKELPLSDLYVCVSKGDVIIHSRALGRQVIPRMSNAHVFGSDQALQIYTFLNEVAIQENRVLPFSLRSGGRARRFYPGLVYDEVIVARPTWKLFVDDVEELRRTPDAQRRHLVDRWRKAYGLPAWVAVVERDIVTPFHLDNAHMLDAFIRLALRQKSVEITDVYPSGMQPAVEGTSGLHHAEVLIPLTAPPESRRAPEWGAIWGDASRMSIWSPWLSLNIYCHPDVQNEVILRLRKKVSELIDSVMVDRFFFVRYADSIGKHLRFRLRTAHDQPGMSLWPYFMDELSAMTQARLVADVSQVSYVREITRYGGDVACGHCEEIFTIDSIMSLDVLKACAADQVSNWHVAAAAFDAMLLALGLDTLEERLDFSIQASANFFNEFSFDSDDRKRVGQVFRQNRPPGSRLPLFMIDEMIGKALSCSSDDIRRVWKRLVGAQQLSTEKLYRLRWSMVHMRANRLFHRDARKQEAVVWDLLRRTYLQALARR